MTYPPHPTFGAWFQRYFLRAWLVMAVCFAGALLLLNNGYDTAGWMLALGFAASGVWTLGFLWYRLYHIECPVCGMQTRTIKDMPTRRFLARCEYCNRTWDSGIGVGTHTT